MRQPADFPRHLRTTYHVPDVEQRVLPAAQLVEPLTPRLAPVALVAPAAVGRAVAQLGSEESQVSRYVRKQVSKHASKQASRVSKLASTLTLT